MPRGGKREGAGRKKQERPLDGNLARKIKSKVKAEEKWILVVNLATNKALRTENTADLRNALEYLDNRDLGTCVDTVNHLHDKPIEMNVTVSLAESVQKARKRASAQPYRTNV